jgi:hypothetical protein
VLVPDPEERATQPNRDDDELVLTPGGWRPKSKVHQLAPGQHISGKDGRLRIIETATGRVVKDLGPTSPRPVDAKVRSDSARLMIATMARENDRDC